MSGSSKDVEHLVQHYVARDRFRVALDAFADNYFATHSRALRLPTNMVSGRASHVTAAGMKNKQIIHATRMGLMGLKAETLDHLHTLLHKEPVLDEDEHVHIDGDDFRYIILEMP